MSVDANFYVLYGIVLGDIGIYEDESNTRLIWSDEENDTLYYDWEKCDELSLEVINDPYDFGSWCVLGFRILDHNPADLIQNIEEAKEKWLKIQDELKEVLGDNYKEPSIVYSAYYS